MMDGEAMTVDTAGTAADEPQEWAILEIFGHRRHAGRIQEVERFGTKMLRIDVPESDRTDAPMVSHFYGGGSIFSLTLTTEVNARRLNRRHETGYLHLPAPDEEDGSGEEDRLV